MLSYSALSERGAPCWPNDARYLYLCRRPGRGGEKCLVSEGGESRIELDDGHPRGYRGRGARKRRAASRKPGVVFHVSECPEWSREANQLRSVIGYQRCLPWETCGRAAYPDWGVVTQCFARRPKWSRGVPGEARRLLPMAGAKPAGQLYKDAASVDRE